MLTGRARDGIAPAAGPAGEHAIEHEGVDVNVEVEGASESLEHGHAAATAVAHPVLTCSAAKVAFNGAVKEARHGAAQVVALLVDPDDNLVERIASEVRPDLIQLHGTETPERSREIQRRTRSPVMKALSVATEDDVAQGGLYFEPGGRADLVLFDAKPPADPRALPGGNGLAFDWRILEGIKGQFPFALAGGLTPENVAEAISLTGAAVVDVS